MILIKIGGGEGINLEGIAQGLSQLDEPFIIVHGANALRDELAKRLGIEKRVVTSVSGYDSVFSDDDTIDLQMMAYAGLRNKRLVELLQQAGCNAMGLTGLDGRLITGRRNRGIRVRQHGKTLLLKDHSGKPKSINTDLLKALLDHGVTPVITVPIADETGKAINTENDDIVALLQSELKAREVWQFITAPGMLQDATDEGTLISNLSMQDLIAMEGSLSGRIKRKIHALKKMLEDGGSTVVITDGRQVNAVELAKKRMGTTIQ